MPLWDALPRPLADLVQAVRDGAQDPALQLAEQALHNGEPLRALESAREVLSRRPSDPAACLLAGLAAESLEMDDLAKPWLEHATRSHTGALPWVGLARIARRDGRPLDELDALLHALRLDRDRHVTAATAERLANVAETLADPLQREAWLHKARNLVPRDPSILLSIARQRARQGETDAVLELLQPWMEAPDNAPLAMVQLAAEALCARGGPSDASRAAAWLERSLQRHDSIEARVVLAHLSLANARPEDAWSWLEPVVVPPAQPTADLLHLAGRVAMARGRIDEAARWWHRGAAHPQASAALYVDLARLALAQGNPGDASLALAEAERREGERAAIPPALRDRVRLAEGGAPPALHGLESDVDSLLLHAQALLAREPLEALRWLHEARAEFPGTPGIEESVDAALRAATPTWPVPEPEVWPDPVAVGTLLEAVAQSAASEARGLALATTLTSARQRLDEPLDVAVLGEFNAGKSTLINALLGEDLLSTGILPTTGHVYALRHGARTAARRRLADGRIEELTWERARALARSSPEDFSELEIVHPHPLLREITIWDTPGFNAPVADHEERAAHALAQAEAVLWILDANQALSASEYERLQSLERADERLLVVINKTDRFGGDTEALDQIEAHVRQHLDGKFAGLHFVSARDVLRRRLEGTNDGDEDRHWRLLEEALRERIAQRAARLKTLAALETLQRWAEARLEDVGHRQEALQPALEGLRALQAEIDTAVPRTELRIGALLQALRADHDATLQRLVTELVQGTERKDSPWAALGFGGGGRPDVDTMRLLRGRLIDSARANRNRMLSSLVAILDHEDRQIAARMEATAREADPEVRDLLRRRRAHWRESSQALRNRLRLLVVHDPLRMMTMRWDLHGASLSKPWELAALQQAKSQEAIAPLAEAIPASEEGERLALESWGREYYAAQRRFCEQVQRDLELVDTRWARRWKAPLRDLLERLKALLTAQDPDEERSL